MMDEKISPDLAARQILVASFCYYNLATPVMDDATYDRLSDYVADNWDQVHQQRQRMLGSADDIRASGMHMKFSSLVVAAALHKIRQMRMSPKGVIPQYPDEWQFDDPKDGGIGHYLTVTG